MAPTQIPCRKRGAAVFGDPHTNRSVSFAKAGVGRMSPERPSRTAPPLPPAPTRATRGTFPGGCIFLRAPRARSGQRTAAPSRLRPGRRPNPGSKPRWPGARRILHRALPRRKAPLRPQPSDGARFPPISVCGVCVRMGGALRSLR